ncbi:Uncharacterized membrane protein YsdA, DUF1294 family [Shimia gijangensis]|uniref:Uncharacterized membrane protein YsdA, DUF1294 family n=1 Tax=Shimia gijangensis TaxID=1470563 RepID=A0A1M6K6T9_9RHOB|nr:DUF1294 domain-containing protein [Shimia gijangensis]SHJ54706.1 Uncharacterized membrane protein YsdA, DUF1294 family [Shimia gijangensis]
MLGNETTLILMWLAAFNALSFLAFGWDKLCARAKWRRIPESTLLMIALLGGSIGARLGQRVFHHKTRKQPFARKLSTILILHGIAFILISVAALVGIIPT